jgi:FkbM family methyltransferase
MLDLVIFSKDRACQLELLLRSLKRFVAGWEELNVSVVHTWSEDAYGAGYAIARELHPEVAWISERDSDAGFRALTLGRLGHGEYTAFLVDDNVFKAPFSLDAPQLRALAEDPELLCLSWRMAPRMNYCYALDTLTPIPDFTDGTVWRWPDAHGDWGYPMSVDGHVFRTAELLPLIGRLPFHNPNTFEAALAANPLPLPKAICLPDAPIVNLPVNRVQDTALNRHGDVAAAWLNERFLAGDRLAVETVIGVANPGPHHEVPLRWEGETVPAEEPAPRVSVVVPCHNLGAYLGEAVRSVLAQDMTDLEVIIVDHGSTDDSPAIADALATTDDRVRVLHRENAGHPAYSRNTGIADARADYVLCLDGDDRLDDPRFVGALANALDVRPSAVVAFGDQQDFGASTTLHQLPGWDFAALTRSNRLSTCSMFRRATWDDVDGYAPVGYEDWDFWIALGETGGTGVKVPGVAWSYRVSDTGRFSEVQPHDQANKAAIVARHPDLYTPAQRAWAQGVLDGDAAALAVPHAPFVIPEAPAVAPVMTVTGLKSFVTVALVDEVLAAPALLRRYASTFTGEDDATLIVYAPDTTPDAVVPQLASILVDVGLSDDASADVILVAAPSADGDAAVRRSAHAVLSDAAIPPTPLDELPRFAEEAIALMLGRADAPADVAPVPAPAATPRSPLHEHYARFMGPGSLVFDIGANVGDRTAIFRELGATVVAVEPQSAVVPRLRSRFADDPQVTIVPMALAAEPAELTMQLNEASTISSMAPDWVDAMRASGRFEGLEWSRTETVTATTLDALIAAHGRPAFCKVDVEGYEPEVFAGLSQPVAAASMEFVAEAPEATLRTCAHLASLGSAEFALSHGESGVLEPWTDLEGLRDELTSVAIVDPQAWGDVYVRFPELAAAAADDEPLGDELEVPADMAWTYNGGHHYEHNVVAWFDRLVDRRDTPAVYDIGANYGYFSALAASRAGSLVAFEPTAATHAVLSRNLRRVGIDPENAVKLALSDAPGTAVIHRYSSSGNNSLYERSLPPGHPLQRDGEETVQVDTLDAVFQRLELAPPEVIKIDVEGAELGVLRGGRETLRAHLPDILLEWGETTSHDAGYERRDVADELERMGYTLFGIAEDPQDMTLHPRRTFGAVAIGTLLATASPEGLVPAAPAVPAVVAHRPPGWDWYTADLHAYRELGGEVADYDLNPQLDDKTPNNPFDQHYFFQDVWAARRVADQRPHTHVDVGSRIDYVGFLTAVVPEVVFVDIRPLPVDIEGFRCVPGSILDLPFADRSLESVSCLHVAEHIGLGRYGDPLDPLGTVKAAAELQRVVAPGGQLLFSGPVGRPRTCFNAHRVHDPVAVLDMFPELELEEFSGVDDGGTFRRHRTPQELVGSTYACGMYLLRRPLG